MSEGGSKTYTDDEIKHFQGFSKSLDDDSHTGRQIVCQLLHEIHQQAEQIQGLQTDFLRADESAVKLGSECRNLEAENKRLTAGINGVFIYYEISKAFDYLRRLLKAAQPQKGDSDENT